MAYKQDEVLNIYLIPDISKIITSYCIPTVEEIHINFKKCLGQIDKEYDKNMAKKRRLFLLNKIKINAFRRTGSRGIKLEVWHNAFISLNKQPFVLETTLEEVYLSISKYS